MKQSELLKLIKKGNNELVRQGSSHEIWKNLDTGKFFTIPRHSKEIPTGTAKQILKAGGIE